MSVQRVAIDVDGTAVSGLWSLPGAATAAYVMGHGAGAGMEHPFMDAVARGLAERRIATLRYQFPFMQQRSKRPDTPRVAQAAVRAAVAEAQRLSPKLPLFAGGKSFGGRMTSQAQAQAPLDGVRGIAFLGFPLHAPGKPGIDRAAHLHKLSLPLLFLQGARDEFAQLELLQPLVGQLGATLRVFEHADHSFHVPARSGRKDTQVLVEVLDVLAGWMALVARG